MRRKRLPKSAIDSGGSGLDMLPVLIYLEICSDTETAKRDVRAGNISLNNQRVKDINHILMPGTYLVSKQAQPFAEVTIL
jgi:hypothetical protein